MPKSQGRVFTRRIPFIVQCELHLVLAFSNLHFDCWLLKTPFIFWGVCVNVETPGKFILAGDRLAFLSYLLYVP